MTKAHADDAGLCLLTGLTALQSLYMGFCRNITDAGLKALVVPLSRHSLSHVHVADCGNITSLSLASLKAPSGSVGVTLMSYGSSHLALLSSVTNASITVQKERHWRSKFVCLFRRIRWAQSAAMWRSGGKFPNSQAPSKLPH